MPDCIIPVRAGTRPFCFLHRDMQMKIMELKNYRIMEDTGMKAPYRKISPTAYMTAYQRSMSDIPFAGEIARETGARDVAEEWLTETGGALETIPSVGLEIRYKAINRALHERGFTRVMELACGFSPRGLEIARDGGRYVGTDLAGLGGAAFPVLRRIAMREGIPADRLRYQMADALNWDEIKRAAGFFHGQRFAVCMEGLLPYLSMEERARLAAHVRKLLEPLGGSWITPDIAYHELIFKSFGGLGAGSAFARDAKKRMEIVKARTGRDFTENGFSGEAEARSFFQDAGFEVEAFPIHEGGATPSTMRLLDEPSRQVAETMLYAPRIWILTPRAGAAR